MNALEFRFAFYARGFEKSLELYRDILGLDYISGWDRADGKGALLSIGGTAVIEIYGAAEGKRYGRRQRRLIWQYVWRMLQRWICFLTSCQA